MNIQNWQQVKELFHGALEREAGARREGFLREACAGDQLLLAQIRSLVAADEEAGNFIVEPARLPLDKVLWEADDAPAVVGQRIGAYEIARELGRGGMGAVYLGVRADAQFDRQVAIKVVKRGMDTDFMLRRFARERQVLASLDHPNIAKLLDGGVTEDGLPCFVMEYVEGIQVDQYCDRHKLSLAQRLRLFRHICSAVSYAHQNLVVHRDLKPSNILVTADGTPKLLDFGIAKLLSPAPSAQTIDQTGMFMRLMTPEYASPEQVRGAPITTASDVYSLGVLLYELLTGRRPYRLKSRAPEEIARAVCEHEPERPSTAIGRVEEAVTADGTEASRTLSPASVATTRDTQPERLRRYLSGDLDNIVLKALRKEPARRYASVEQLSEDIRRHLEGLPVAARHDTFTYRAGKFIRRHRAGVAAAALILLTIIAGTGATLWEARRAQVERGRAERRFNDVRRLANSFLFEFHDAIKDLPGSTPARQLLIARGLEYLDSLSQEAKNDSTLQRELAAAYEKLGDLQGKTMDANIGDTDGALASYRKALALREALVRTNAASTENRHALADSYNKLGMLLWQTSERDAALENVQKAVQGYQESVAAAPENTALLYDLANGSLNAGMILLEQGRTAEALTSQRQALAIFEGFVATDPHDNQARRALSRSYEKIGNVLLASGDAAGALEFNRKALALRSALAAENPTNTDFRRGVGISYEKIGDMLTRLGDINGALESYRKELAICQSLADADTLNAQFRGELSSPYERLGETLARLGQTDAALALHRRALSLREELLAADPANAWKRWDVIESRAKVARLLAAVGDSQAALKECLRAEDLVEATPDFLKDIVFRRYRADADAELGEAYALLASSKATSAGQRLAHWRAAHRLYQRSLEVWLGMRDQGVLVPLYADKPDQIRRQIARCDVELAKLPGGAAVSAAN